MGAGQRDSFRPNIRPFLATVTRFSPLLATMTSQETHLRCLADRDQIQGRGDSAGSSPPSGSEVDPVHGSRAR